MSNYAVRKDKRCDDILAKTVTVTQSLVNLGDTAFTGNTAFTGDIESSGNVTLTGDVESSGTVTLTGTLDLCNATVINPGECNPLHGWWRNESKTNGADFAHGYLTSPYIFIDTLSTPPSIKHITTRSKGEPCYPTVGEQLLIVSDLSVSEIIEDGRVFIYRDTFFPGFGINYDIAITLDADNVTAWVDNLGILTPNSGGGFNSISKLTKITEAEVPMIRPAGNDGAFADVNDPVFMFNETVEIFTNSSSTLTPSSLGGPDGTGAYVGLAKATAFKTALLSTGSTRATGAGTGISLTQILQSVAYPGRPTSSTLIFDADPAFNRCSTITISGLSAPWDALNGEHKVIASDTNETGELDPLFVAAASYRVVIPTVDTSGFAAYVSGTHGQPTITTTYGPVTGLIEYRDLMAAIIEWHKLCYPVGCLHDQVRFYVSTVDPFNCIETFDELATRLADGTATQYRNGFRNGGIVGSYMYGRRIPPPGFNPFESSSNYAPWNAPYQIDIAALGHSTVGNYIVERKYLWFDIDNTTPITTPLHFNIQFIYGNPGSRFKGLVSSFGPESGTPPTSTALSMNGTDNDDFWFGVIKPEFSGGQKIGYIYLATTLQLDPGQMMFHPSFGADGSPLRKEQGLYDVFSVMMNWLVTTEAVDDIIIDIRGNAGGYLMYYLASFFGQGSRIGASNLIPFANQDNQAPLDMQLIPSVYSNGVNVASPGIQDMSADQTFDMNPTAVEAEYPGSVFSGGKVIILTDRTAASGGDIFPRLFQGDALDGDIGGGTQAIVMGDIDGRLFGTSSMVTAPIQSDTNSRFKNSSGDVVAPFAIRSESLIALQASAQWTGERNDFLKPKPQPFSALVEDTVYPDFGFVAHPTAVVPGDVRAAPTPGDTSTWRDSWLEQCIREARSLPILLP